MSLSGGNIPFHWRKRVSTLPMTDASKQLDEPEEEESSVQLPSETIGGSANKRAREAATSDRAAELKRTAECLKDEGVQYAEKDRYEDAIRVLSQAADMNPTDPTITEMLSQVYTMHEDHYRAVLAAQRSVKSTPLWPVAYQTLGRAHMNLGEVDLAISAYCKAIHLDPSLAEIRETDLPYALSVKAKMKNQEDKAKGEDLLETSFKSSKPVRPRQYLL